MMFKPDAPLYATEVERKQGEDTLYINFLSAPFVPSLAENAMVMERVLDLMLEHPQVSHLVFVQQRNYHYPSEQVLLLSEIANIYNYITKQENLLSLAKLNFFGDIQQAYTEVSALTLFLREDPLGCYTHLKKRILTIRNELSYPGSDNEGRRNLVLFLERLLTMLEQTTLIRKFAPRLSDFPSGSREIYGLIFRPDILPNFTFTRLVSQLPLNAELIDQYMLTSEGDDITVTILRRRGDVKHFYHIMPPEYSLSEEQHMLLTLARNVIIEHRPKAEEFTDPEKTRQVFFNVARDLISELAVSKNIMISHRDLAKLARILVRYTIGFGLLEILLMDTHLQDISVNAPIALNPVFVRHEKYDECVTNIIPSFEDADSWAAKLRLQSGRPLDEANPVLDTDLVFSHARARVAAVKEPLSPSGLAYSLRRHRDNPWTLPLFIKLKTINSFGAGLLSFIIDGNRTLLVAGTRSSGKTSLLGSLMLEIMPKVRTIVIEDTLELPVDALRKVGYDILRMKVRSALVTGTTEVEASEGIRTSLRLGDSALIVGEVRSSEARALYEAMRVGALANVVAGTIHGDSPYGVFDRVVNDLNVPATSFKATDIIVITNPVKTPDGIHSLRRVMSITEVRKHWDKDPLQEGGFVDLMRYNVETDILEPTPELINGESEVLKSIAGSVRGWAGNWNAIYDNIILRGRIKQEIVDAALRFNKPDILEAEFCTASNNMFHILSEKFKDEKGVPLSEQIFAEWKNWLYSSVEDY